MAKRALVQAAANEDVSSYEAVKQMLMRSARGIKK